MPFTLRNVFLDHENDLVAINLQLERVEQLSKRQGHAIAIGHTSAIKYHFVPVDGTMPSSLWMGRWARLGPVTQ